MVWFQCEDCGENLKKSKLPNHFRICSTFKLSCIDCGEVFGRQSVQSHTQCITEAEKYGPKGPGITAYGTPAKPRKDKPKPDVDITIGLSDRPPWFCSLCNTKATSNQALLLHADGKKHRAKVRARTAAQQPKQSEESIPTDKDATESTIKNVSLEDKSTKDKKENGSTDGATEHVNFSVENGNVPIKKRKMKPFNNGGSIENDANKLGNGNVSKTEELEDAPKKKKSKHKNEPKAEEKKKVNYEDDKDDSGVQTVAKKEGSGQNIKWKKLITGELKSAPDRVLKMKKLRKLISKSLRESGVTFDDSELSTTLEQKVHSSSKFTVDGKCIRLAD